MSWKQKKLKIKRSVEKLLQLAEAAEPPVPVERIARLCGAQIRYVPSSADLSGLIFQENGNVIIGVNALHAKTRQRFTIAHELGHLELHNHGELHVDRNFRVMPRNAKSSQATDPEEIEANTFAAELLMPEHMLEHDLQQHSVDWEDDEFLRSLAERYKVSVQALIFRLINLGYISNHEDLKV
jgi:Zn-dependent peptidase ImmA (M78 family)